jgi:hypothetical protein
VELAQCHLGLEAQPEGAPVADRAGEEAARDGAEKHGEVLGTARDQAMGEKPRSGAESGPGDDPDNGKADDDRRGALQKMPCVLLDDALVQIFHPHSSSAAPAPILSRLNNSFIDSHLAPNQAGHSVVSHCRESGEKHT